MGIFLCYGFGFILFGAIALNSVLSGDWNELFKLGNVQIPTYFGAGATNLDVFIFCLIGMIALCVAVVSRYFYYRKTIEYLRSKGIEDYDNDGRVDSFADEFLDDDFP